MWKIVGLIVLLSGMANAGILNQTRMKAHQLQQLCSSKTDAELGFCAAYIAGVIDGTYFSREMAKKTESEVLLAHDACVPRSIPTEALISVFLAHILTTKRTDPKAERGRFASVEIISAFSLYYPCKK